MEQILETYAILHV